MSGFDKFFSEEPILFEGHVVNSEKGSKRYAIQVHPGLVIDVDKKHIESLEEATDPVSARQFVRVTLKKDSEIRAVFEPRLARLALTSKTEGGIPFSVGGCLPDAEEGGAVYAQIPTGPIIPGGGGLGLGTIGERSSRCKNVFWGWTTDDRGPYTDY